VKLTGFPWQTGFGEAVMVTVTGMELLTVIVKMFEMAGLPDKQDKLDVRMTDIRSLFAGVYVNVEVLVPAFVPLTFH